MYRATPSQTNIVGDAGVGGQQGVRESTSLQTWGDAVLFADGGDRGRPGVVRVEIRKGGQRRRRFDFCQTVQPLRKGLLDLVLGVNQPAQEPEIPWTERVDCQMNEGVSLDTDRVQCARGACELQRGTDSTDQPGPC